MTTFTPDTLRTMIAGLADKVAELQARFDRHIHPVAGDDIEMTAGPVWEGVEPMRCAECNCKYGDSDCNWIATPRMTATTEAAPTGAMTDDEIVAKVMASRIDRNLADLFCDVIRLTRASDRAAMQAAVEALREYMEHDADYCRLNNLGDHTESHRWKRARAALDALKGAK